MRLIVTDVVVTITNSALFIDRIDAGMLSGRLVSLNKSSRRHTRIDNLSKLSRSINKAEYSDGITCLEWTTYHIR